MAHRNRQADEFIELTAMSGELPSGTLHRLGGGSHYKKKLVINLKKSGDIKTHYKDGLRGYRLTPKTKKNLAASNPDRFRFYLTGDVDTNNLPSSITRRLRLHRVSNAMVTMYNSGVEIFRDKKAEVFSSQNSNNIKIDKPCFYTSREYKEFCDDAFKVKNGRAVGVLMTGAEIYMVYNTENYDMKWDYKSESDMKAAVGEYLYSRGISGRINGLLLGNSMEMMLSGTKSEDHIRRGFFFIDGTFRKFLYLTNDKNGEILLRLLCDSELRTELDALVREKLNLVVPDIKTPAENDGADAEGNLFLFAYIPDMPKLTRFCTALKNNNLKGSVICFDFQKDVLAEYCGETVEFETIVFAEFERSFFGENS